MAGVLATVRMEGGDQRQGEKHRREPRLTGSGHRPTWEKQSQEPRAETKRETPWETNRNNGDKAKAGVTKKSQKKTPEDRKRQREKDRRTPAGTSERPGRGEAEGGGERAILTEETGGGARRKSFPHQHILFQKSSKLCWNESERITESQPARERRK